MIAVAVPRIELCGALLGGELDPGAGAVDVGVVQDHRARQDDDGPLEVRVPGALGVSVVRQRRVAEALVDPVRLIFSFGAKSRTSQLEAWKWTERAADPPWSAVIRPSTAKGSQLVGLRVKSLRSRSIRTERSRSGMPSRIRGSGSEATVIWAVTGSIADRGSHHHVAEVVGAGDRRGDDREAERRPLVRTGEVDPAGR